MTARTSAKRGYGNDFMDAVIPLLKEYTSKLQECAVEVDKVRRWYEGKASERQNGTSREYLASWIDSIRFRVERLRGPVEELDRRVSQMIEHGELDSELDRLELQIRLAELEGVLRAAIVIANTNLPT